MRHRLRPYAAVFAVVAMLASCGGDGAAGSNGGAEGEPAKLTLAIASAVVGPKEEVAVFAVAKRMGFFKKEKLTVDTINADGSVAAVQAVASGSAQLTAADAGSVLSGVEKNVPITMIGGLVQNWPWQIATTPDSDIDSGESLQGRKVGVISLASGSAPYARAFAKGAGLDPERDVELLPVGVGPQAASSLNSGEVDALALYGQAYSVIETAGTELEYLANPNSFDGIRSLSFAASARELSESPDVYERFLRAAYKALLFSAQNPEAAMRIGYEEFPQILGGATVESRLKADVASLEAWLESATPAQGEPSSWTDWGAISEEDLTATQAYTQEAGQISEPVDLDEAWDPSLLKGANEFDRDAVIEQADDYQP